MSHKCSCSHPLHVHDSNYTHPLTSLQWSYGSWPAIPRPDLEKSYPAGNRHRARQNHCFLNPFMHRRTVAAHLEPTKVFLKLSPDRDGHAVYLRVHPPTSPCSTLSAEDKSFMSDIAGYIQERVKVIHNSL